MSKKKDKEPEAAKLTEEEKSRKEKDRLFIEKIKSIAFGKVPGGTR